FGANTGAVNTTITGGSSPYTYNWGGGINSPNRANLRAGNYNVTFTYNNFCTAAGVAVITQPAALTVLSAVTNPGCSGTTGSISLAVNGGTQPYIYLWSNGASSPNISGLTPGPYSVTVTDNSACSASSSATITPGGSLSVAIAQVNVSCNGLNNGSINLTVTGGSSPY